MSVENYQKEMITAKTSNSNLDALTSTSKTSVWRMMLYIMAFSVEQLAQLFLVHRSEIDTKISTYNGNNKEFSIIPPIKIAVFIEPIP